VLIHKKAQEFGNGYGRMGIVELKSIGLMETVKGLSPPEMKPDHVLERAGDEEILLFQSQVFALEMFVVRIKHLRHVL
jgi:hypothetical protein